MKTPRKNRVAFMIGLAALLLLLVSCQARIQPPAIPTPTAVIKCAIPDLSGMDQQAATNSLTALGLSTIKQTEFSESVPANQVIFSDPPAGSTMLDCRGNVTLTISLGLKPAPTSTPTEVPPLPTPTPAAVSTPTTSIPDVLAEPMFRLLYSENFDTPKNGFNPAWQVTYGENGASKTNAGWLELTGYVTALTRDPSWQDYIVTISDVTGRQYFLNVYFRMQDLKNGYVMSCKDIASSGANDAILRCEWDRIDDGKRVELPGTVPGEVCTGECDIRVEARGAEFRFRFNGQEKFRFSDDKYPSGLVGFTANSPSTPLRLYSFDVSEPDHPASVGVTLFRDDFKTGGWYTGSGEDDYTVYEQTLASGRYRWDITAKQAVALKECNTGVILPDVFTFSASFRPLTGPADMSYNLIFNCQDLDNLYFFRVNAGGSYGLYKFQNGEWETIRDDAPVTIKPADVHNLMVIGGFGHYMLFLDGKMLASFQDDSFTHGGIGVGLELFQSGDRALLEIDDVFVNVP